MVGCVLNPQLFISFVNIAFHMPHVEDILALFERPKLESSSIWASATVKYSSQLSERPLEVQER